MAIFSADERQLLHDSVNAFLKENYGFERWKKLARGPEMEGFGRAEWAKYAELGWLGVALPEWAGGTSGGMTELGIVMAAAGRHMVLEPLLGTIVLGARAIEEAGTETQRETLLPLIATGRLLLAFCHAEPGGGYARDYVHAIARQEGSEPYSSSEQVVSPTAQGYPAGWKAGPHPGLKGRALTPLSYPNRKAPILKMEVGMTALTLLLPSLWLLLARTSDA